MDLDRLVRTAPKVHDQGTMVWALAREPLQYIWDTVEPGWNTAETGLGVSTIVFAVKQSNHTCITPSTDEIDRLRDYCTANNVSLNRTSFVIQESQFALPSLPVENLDFVLIDGGHGFPLPFLDWFYFAERLRVGGYLMIDDTQIWTGKVLKEFLQAEPGWSCEKTFVRAAVFKMTTPYSYREWITQPYVTQRSWWPAHRAEWMKNWELLCTSDMVTIWAAIKKRINLGR